MGFEDGAKEGDLEVLTTYFVGFLAETMGARRLAHDTAEGNWDSLLVSPL